MPSVYTKEGRKVLRQQELRANRGSGADLSKNVCLTALDLLDRQQDSVDIAEEIVKWLEGSEHAPKVPLRDLVAKWQASKGGDAQ